MSGPEPIEGLIQHAKWTRDALDRAVLEPPPASPEGETAAERFTRTMNEQADAERRDAELVQRVEHEHPDAPTREAPADPLRAEARESRARRRRRTRRLPR